MGDEIPDPLLKETFDAAVLDWSEPATPAGGARRALVRDLLAVRRREITPHLSTAAFGAAQHVHNVITASWRLSKGKSLVLLANLSNDTDSTPPLQKGRPIWGGEPGGPLAPWSVRWSIGEA
jgi:maltooligosyltrehalose trehalohydrolase